MMRTKLRGERNCWVIKVQLRSGQNEPRYFPTFDTKKAAEAAMMERPEINEPEQKLSVVWGTHHFWRFYDPKTGTMEGSFQEKKYPYASI